MIFYESKTLELQKKNLDQKEFMFARIRFSVPATDTAIRQMIKETDSDNFED